MVRRFENLDNHIKLTVNIVTCPRSGVSQSHANFRTSSSFSSIPVESLSLLPLVYETNVYRLSLPLHLKAIIKMRLFKIFRLVF